VEGVILIEFTSSGSFDNMEKFLKAMQKKDFRKVMEAEAERGKQALIKATPRNSGITASSWGYKIGQNKGSITITWTNSHVNEGVPIAVILQYGHGTGTGGYVQGIDYINPAMKPIFDSIADKIWKAVTSA
jgi:hypothetical protein